MDSLGEQHSFKSNTREAALLCWGTSVIQGAFVLRVNSRDHVKITPVSAPRPWPKLQSKETWRIEQNPEGNGQIWISSQGRISWKTPGEEGLITFEERSGPESSSSLEEHVRDFETKEDQHWRRFFPRLEVSEEDVEGEGDELEEEASKATHQGTQGPRDLG